MVKAEGKFPEQDFVIGMDAGGTKTKVLLANMEGAVLDSFEGEGMNVNSFGLEGTAAHLRSILEEAGQRSGGWNHLKRLCIGIAGISNPDTQRILKQEIAAAGIPIEPLLLGDNIVALYGADSRGTGIMLIAGTGSVCTGRTILPDGSVREARSGGWGHLIDDEGSAYAIARDVLATIVRSLDGREEKTVMWDAVREILKINTTQELIRFVYSPETGKKEIASLAPVVMKGVEAGETAAFNILRKAASQLAEMVSAVAVQLQMETGKVSVGGSVLTKNDLLLTFLKKELEKTDPGLTLGLPEHDAAQGAVTACLASLK